METIELFKTGAAAVAFAAAFLVGGRLRPFRSVIHPRSVISFGAGISAAYVFVHVLPELQGVRHVVTTNAVIALPYKGAVIYFVAMLGFLAFYGLARLAARLTVPAGHDERGGGGTAFAVHIGGFAVYVWLAGYLLVHKLEGGTGTGFYAAALFVHFLTVDHSLHEAHGVAYERRGRFILAGMCLAGWASAQLFALPATVTALLVAFISGGVVMNSAIMELPTEQHGRFVPFMVGALIYGLALLPLG